MTEQDIILIEKYLNKELQGAALVAFEQRLENEPKLKRIVHNDQILEAALRPHPLIRARYIFDRLEEDFWTEEEKKKFATSEESEAENPALERAPDLPEYTDEELQALFQPLKELELEAIRRSTHDNQAKNRIESLVLLPGNDHNCRRHELIFDFEEALPFPLEMVIINNKERPLKTATIPEGVFTYTTSLDGFSPGRYYWQLTANIADRSLIREYGMATGSFLLGGDLNPNI